MRVRSTASGKYQGDPVASGEFWRLAQATGGTYLSPPRDWLGAGYQRSDNTIGGIAVDGEYVVFVIDSSGSMFFNPGVWPRVMKKLNETLSIYPALKGIQVMSDRKGRAYTPGTDQRISVYAFGDDFTCRSIDELFDAVDRINAPDEHGQRPVRINVVGFPHLYKLARVYRFAAAMRELTFRNNGTFVGLDSG